MRLDTLGRMLTGGRPRAPRAARRQRSGPVPAAAVAALETRVLPSVSVVIDYSLDRDHFFDPQARRDLMQAAADAIASTLNDHLAAIAPGGINSWSAQFPDPATGTLTSASNLYVPADTLIIYVGGGRLPGASEAGLGSTGGYSATGDQAWLDTVTARGQAGALNNPQTDFGPWGGSIAFDDSGSTSWYFGRDLAGLGSGQTDFLSVAEHEIGHVLGIGTAPSWSTHVAAGAFVGAHAEAAFGGPVPLSPGGDHWAQGIRSDGGNALMDPVLITGTRSVVTTLDFAALQDIGWQVAVAPPSLSFASTAYATPEGGGSVVVTVTRTGAPRAVSVNYATGDGTARAGVDYQPAAGTLNFGPGETTKTFAITILNDGQRDGVETVNLALGGATGGGVVGPPGTAVLTIADPSTTYQAPADFDPDGRSDLAVFRPAGARWYVDSSASGPLPVVSFGAPNLYDIPVVGDFDGVGHAELAVFRPSTSQWFVLGPGGGHLLGVFGAPNLYDIPVPGDYDGVGHTEMAVFRPSTSQWFVMGPTGGHLLGVFGAPNLYDIPVPGDYDGVGHTEMAVFRKSTAQWFVMGPTGGYLLGSFGAPNLYDVPAPGDFDGVGHTEMGVYRRATGQWFGMSPGGGRYLGTYGDPNSGDLPVESSIGSLARLGATTRIMGKSVSQPPRGGAEFSVAGRSGPVSRSSPVVVAPPPDPIPLAVPPRRRVPTVIPTRRRLGSAD